MAENENMSSQNKQKKKSRLLAPVFLYNVVRNVLQFAVFFFSSNLTVYTINQDVELYHLHLQCPCRNFIKNTFFKIFVTILLRYFVLHNFYPYINHRRCTEY